MLVVNDVRRRRNFILEGKKRLVLDATAARDIADEQHDEKSDEGEADKSGESDDYHDSGAKMPSLGWDDFTGGKVALPWRGGLPSFAHI